MRLRVTVQNLLDLFEEFQSQTRIPYQMNGCETLMRLPQRFGNSLIRHWHLQEGLDLYVQSHDLTEEIMVESHNGYEMIGLAYCLSGNLTILVNQSGAEVALRPGSCLACNLLESETVGQLSAQQPISLVELAIAPTLLQTVLADEVSSFSAALSPCFQQPDHPYWQQGILTPAMMTTLYQILHCPYYGVMQRLYLESKAWELIVFQLTQLRETQAAFKHVPLKPDDIDRIYQAHQILIQNLHHPPSLLDLARQVGLNDYKLKQGFRQVFGTTAFGCLHQYRMEQARHLLEIQKVQVAIAAHAVGYSSLSSFHRAYKKYFGLNPGIYRKGDRG